MARMNGAWAIDKNTGERVQSSTVQGALDNANAMNSRYRPQLAGSGNVAPGQTKYVPGLGTVRASGQSINPSVVAFNARTENNGFSRGYGNDTPLGQLAKGQHFSQRGNTVVQNGITYGANGKRWDDNLGGAEGSGAGVATLPGMGGSGSAGGGSAIQGQVSNAISQNITTPGIKPADVQGMKTRARDSVARGAVGQRSAATNALRAAGFGQSGDRVGSMVDINTNAAAEANRMARDIELDAATKNAGFQQSAISQGLQLAGMQNDQAQAAQRRFDVQQAQAVAAAQPEFTAGGFTFGGRGGGANARDTDQGPWTRNQFRGGMTAPGLGAYAV